MAEVSILSIREEPVFLPGNRVERETIITYSSRDSAPRTVRLPGRDPTDEAIAKAIREDLEKASLEGPRTLQI